VGGESDGNIIIYLLCRLQLSVMDKSHREQLELVSEMHSSAECNFESNEENLKTQRISPGILERMGLNERNKKANKFNNKKVKLNSPVIR